jgi:hypothetical protein
MIADIKINEMLSYLNSIPEINEGGCGIVALTIYRWYVKHYKKKDIKIYYLYHKDSINYSVNERKNRPSAATHIIVKINDKYVDTRGIFNTMEEISTIDNIECTKFHIFNVKFLIKSINNIGVWRDDFNREHIKRISEKLQINLADIKCN